MSQRPLLEGIKTHVSGMHSFNAYDHDQLMLKKGQYFQAIVGSYTNSLNSGDYIDIGFKVPNTKSICMKYNFISKGACHLELYHNCNWSGLTGTLVNALNRNGLSNNVSVIQTNVNSATWEASGAMMKGMSGFSGALAFERWAFGEKKTPAAQSAADIALICRTGIQYAFKLYSDADSNSVQLDIFWCEEDI